MNNNQLSTLPAEIFSNVTALQYLCVHAVVIILVNCNAPLLTLSIRSIPSPIVRVKEQIEYFRQKSVVPGHDSVLLCDPAGNWIEIAAMTQFR